MHAGVTSRLCASCSSFTVIKVTCKRVWLWRLLFRVIYHLTRRPPRSGSFRTLVRLTAVPLSCRPSQSNRWRSSELLHRLQLWSAAIEIIRICPIDDIRAINQVRICHAILTLGILLTLWHPFRNQPRCTPVALAVVGLSTRQDGPANTATSPPILVPYGTNCTLTSETSDLVTHLALVLIVIK